MIGRKRNSKHFQKNAVFDILSLADQLHYSKFTDPKNPEQKKIYFPENQVLDLIDLGQKYLAQAIALYNKSIKRKQEKINIIDKDVLALEPNKSQNKIVDEPFNRD